MKNNTIITVIATLAFIMGIVALCIYNVFMGVAVFILVCAILFFGALYFGRHKTPEEYITNRNKRIKPVLEQIHQLILKSDPRMTCSLDPYLSFPLYKLSISSDKIFPLIAVQAIIGNKYICIYPYNQKVFEVFSDKLKDYKNNDSSEIFLPVDNMDFDFIKDIITYNIGEVENYCSLSEKI